ncbi:MAG: zinc-dependent alcohol dehydrogenase family protein [Chloroflexi bacterium]|nr:zinc-dependent alcohol dehydrogenase family protein [Chloroflexota bacterium]
MKAAVLRKPQLIEQAPLDITDLPAPKPGPGQVRIKVSACGICHTDLHIVEGEIPSHRLPLIPGHQVVGTVDSLGEGVTALRVGDRVGMPWLYSSCGKCSFCLEGRENLCLQAHFTGYDMDGGYCQYTVVPESFAQPLPGSFSDLQAAPLLCAGIIGFRALRVSEIKPGQNLGLYGFGASAHIAIQVALHWGCRVYVFTRSQEHKDLAMRLGAVWTGGAEDLPPQKLHSAIVFAPAGSVVPRAMEALERGGTLALAGIYMSPISSLDYTRHLYYERTLRSVSNATRKDAQDLLRLAVEIPVRTEVQVFPLEEANRALLLLKQGKIQGAGVLKVT